MSELSLDDSQPIELYEFTSLYQSYFYTSDILQQSADSHTYQPLSGLERSSITVGTHENDKDELKVKVPLTSQIAIDWAFGETPPDMELSIKRLDRAGGSTYLIWKGRVSTIEIQKHLAVMKCPTRFVSILNGKVPTILIQQQCNHVLFDEMCKVDRDDYKFTSTVAAVNGSLVTLDDLGSELDVFYTNGELLNLETGERRTISAKTSYVVKLIYSMNISVGDSVEVTLGCDHIRESPQGCQKFNNLPNFGGFPYIPGEDKNIFQVGII